MAVVSLDRDGFEGVHLNVHLDDLVEGLVANQQEDILSAATHHFCSMARSFISFRFAFSQLAAPCLPHCCPVRILQLRKPLPALHCSFRLEARMQLQVPYGPTLLSRQPPITSHSTESKSEMEPLEKCIVSRSLINNLQHIRINTDLAAIPPPIYLPYTTRNH